MKKNLLLIKKFQKTISKKITYKKLLRNTNSLQTIQDPVYKSGTINLLINHFMRGGKKGQSEKIILNIFKYLKWSYKIRPFFVYHEIIEQAKPIFSLVPKRVGKIRRYIPFPMQADKRVKKAIFWLQTVIKNRKERSIGERFIKEFNDIALNKRTQLFIYKEDIEKRVVENRAYLHFRWK